MSNQRTHIPESLDHFAMKIISRLHLDKAATIGFVSRILREAVYEERKTVHLREAVSCFGCRTVMLRYEGVNEQYCTRCPSCREPMLTQEVLYRKKFHLLQEQLREAAEATADSDSEPSGRTDDRRVFEANEKP